MKHPNFTKLFHLYFQLKDLILNLKKVKKNFYYSSFNNKEWIDKVTLKKLIKDLN